MFIHYVKESQKVPIVGWLPDISTVEPGCLEQAINLSNLPFTFKHVALMPDTHQGYGMPIGGVLATEGVIIPNAVGVDIGCGMTAAVFDVPARLLRETRTPNGTLAQTIAGDIMRSIPAGFQHRKDALPVAIEVPGTLDEIPELLKQYHELGYQAGTLGGGNHFIELQEDLATGETCIMIHSGSRNFGKQVADYFNRTAVRLNEEWRSEVPRGWQLAFLPLDHERGQQYVLWMNVALSFAKLNREYIMAEVIDAFSKNCERYLGAGVGPIVEQVECHHNYAAIEHHFGRDVVVHRKGAIRMRKGEKGIIPGAMGGYSYIVEGLGNPESFHSASHGAGRLMGRKEAERQFTVEKMMDYMKKHDVVLGTQSKKSALDEFIGAYKDIDWVIQNESDLVEVRRKLKTVVVVKG